MNTNMLQIRWHGRGGQGAKTAASMLAEALIGTGHYAQAAPEYGAERQGAPVKAFTRISDQPIRVHDAIYHPDIVVVLDESLLDSENVTEGLAEDGLLLVNSKHRPQAVRDRLSLDHARIYAVDATGIALNEIGRPIPNTVMIGALLKARKLLPVEKISALIRKKLQQKHDKNIAEANVKAVRRAFEEVEEEK